MLQSYFSFFAKYMTIEHRHGIKICLNLAKPFTRYFWSAFFMAYLQSRRFPTIFPKPKYDYNIQP
ncbi:hypothetical protein BpHYR1_036455 [Brachionus plicatilis]|uniref:Uncharacterized protein n=1 Tax=Brachionus plicatilis TaxID=10195 RepID=A0A3M7SRB4_BRAPC|nr:hypothetical protein BpHYR1_036455 [Brachionus plicatilis]